MAGIVPGERSRKHGSLCKNICHYFQINHGNGFWFKWRHSSLCVTIFTHYNGISYECYSHIQSIISCPLKSVRMSVCVCLCVRVCVVWGCGWVDLNLLLSHNGTKQQSKFPHSEWEWWLNLSSCVMSGRRKGWIVLVLLRFSGVLWLITRLQTLPSPKLLHMVSSTCW